MVVRAATDAAVVTQVDLRPRGNRVARFFGTSIDAPDPRQFDKGATEIRRRSAAPAHSRRVAFGGSACWHRAIHCSAERSAPLAIAPSALKRHPASFGEGSRLAAAKVVKCSHEGLLIS